MTTFATWQDLPRNDVNWPICCQEIQPIGNDLNECPKCKQVFANSSPSLNEIRQLLNLERTADVVAYEQGKLSEQEVLDRCDRRYFERKWVEWQEKGVIPQYQPTETVNA